MILDEISLYNFSVFKGYQTIPLKPSARSKPVILFGGQNGVGKTTFLDAIHLALYGKFAQCSNRGSLNYEEYLFKCINKSTDPKEGAAIYIKFRHMSDGEEQIIDIKRTWSQRTKNVREYVEVLKNGKYDGVLTDNWNEYVEQYFPPRIAPFFFFDGEKIERFADLENCSDLLSTAIHTLLGLDIIDQLSGDLLVLMRRKRQTLKIDVDNIAIDNLHTDLDRLNHQKTTLRQERASFQNEIDQKEKSLKTLNERYRQIGGDLFDRRSELETKRTPLQNQLGLLKEDLICAASGAAPLLLLSDLVNNILKQATIEENIARSIILHTVLDKRDKHIINYIKQHDIPAALIKRIEKYLHTDRASRIKGAKGSKILNLDGYTTKEIRYLFNHHFNEIKAHIPTLISKYECMLSDIDELDRMLSSVSDIHALNSLNDERDKNRLQIEELKFRTRILDENINKVERDISQKQARLTALIQKNVEADLERDDVARIIHHSTKARVTLAEYRNRMLRNHLDKISEYIHESIQLLTRKQDLINKLSIDPITFSLMLYDRSGNVITSERLSAGERQILALSILWGLARASGKPLPTAIDTPLGRLDSVHRSYLIERYLPQASHQVLVFSTDEEIDRARYKVLKPYISHSYILDYDDKDAATTIKPGYFS